MFNSIWLFVTEACNLRCHYCFNPHEILTNPETLAIDDFKQMFDNLLFINEQTNPVCNKKLSLVFFGGEPTMYPELLQQIMAYSYDKTGGTIRFSLLTNAYNLDSIKEYILDFKTKYKLQLQLSIDSDPAIESERCNGFDLNEYNERIDRALAFLFEYTIRFNIRATLTTKYLTDYAHNYTYFMNLNNNGYTPTTSIMPDYVRSSWTKKEFEILTKEVTKIIQAILKRYHKTGKLYEEKFTTNAFKLLYFEEEGIKPRRDQHIQLCGFCSSLFSISPKGDLYACQRVYKQPDMCVGNLRDMSIDMQKIEAIRSVYNNRLFTGPHPDIGVTTCEECFMYNSCAGVCPAENFEEDDITLDMQCNKTLYKFHKVFYDAVKQLAWKQYKKDPAFRDEVVRIVKKDMR